jgi:hypothetical protein
VMDENVFISREAVEKMLKMAGNKQGKVSVDEALKMMAELLGAFNKNLRKQGIDRALRHILVVGLQQHLLNK